MIKLLPLTIALAALSPIAVSTATAADHTGHKMSGMSHKHTGQAELGATALFDAKGVLWAAHKDAGHIVVSSSTDLGKSWSTPVRATQEPEETDSGGEARPKIAFGRNGEIYVTWTKKMKTPYSGEIRFARSVDGGQTFLAPITVHHNQDDITHRFDVMAINKKGQIFITWIDKRDGIAATKAKTPYRGAAVYFAVSDDQGATFRGDFKLADYSCECCRIALAVRSDDTVVAMWRHVFAPNIRDHAIAVLHPDGTAGEVRRATYDDWHLDGCPHHGPSLADDSQGRIHAVWFTQGEKNQGSYYGRLREGGVELQRHLGGKASAHPDLAIAGPRVAVAWTEFDGERTRLRAMVSENAGESWQEHDLVATNSLSDQPRVLTKDNKFYVFWNTRNEPRSLTPIP